MSENTPEEQPSTGSPSAAADIPPEPAADISPSAAADIPPEPAADAERPVPRAAPRPGAPRPRVPGPTPGHRSTPVASPAPASDPHRFGRVDADGGVWLRTPSGERQVGSWQAGEPDEGLAHFGRRFDDLATEVTILERRVASGSGDARQTQDSARTLVASLPTAAVVGDLESVAARLQAVLERCEGAVAAAKARKEAARAAQLTRKETLATEAEQIGAESSQWKVAGDRLREILEEWKTIHGVDRKSDDALWKRFSKAREAFNRRRGAHFAELDRERVVARTRKEELVAQAEELSTSTDFARTAGRFRDLMGEWKAAGRAPRDTDDLLWTSFKASQDRFFAARDAVNTEKDSELANNGAAKQALLVEAEGIDPGSGVDQAKSALRSVQERWDAAGRVPREQVQSLESRMRAVEQKVRDADEARWKRSDPEAEARAAQFRERVTQLEEQATKARSAGDQRRATEAAEQAAQWREWADAAEGAVRR